MILSDRDIKKALKSKRLVIEDYEQGAIQPVSVDLMLGDKFRIFKKTHIPIIDVKQELRDLTEVVAIDEGEAFYLHPGDFVLGITREWIGLPADLMGRLDGKSSLGRLGLLVHSTAGFIDPGFRGRIVLEFTNVSPMPISLYPGMAIAQVSFYELTHPAQRPYGHGSRNSKYQDQDEPTPSRYYLNFQKHSRAGRRAREQQYRTEPTPIKLWLDESRFRGNVRQFADALDIPVKTVEDWVYGRFKPGSTHAAKLFEVTGLPQYHSEQHELFDEGHGD